MDLIKPCIVALKRLDLDTTYSYVHVKIKNETGEDMPFVIPKISSVYSMGNNQFASPIPINTEPIDDASAHRFTYTPVIIKEEVDANDGDEETVETPVLLRKVKTEPGTGKMMGRHSTSSKPRPPPSPVRCKRCAKYFKTEEGLSIHMKSYHGKSSYVCPVCHQDFPNSESVSAHFAQAHTTKEEHTCPVCGKLFNAFFRLRMHIANHKPNLMKCPQCPKSFRYLEELQDHMEEHVITKDFECSVCGKFLATAKTFQDHIDAHSIKEKKTAAKIDESMVSFNCRKCNKVFVKYSALLHHLGTHKTGNSTSRKVGRPFKKESVEVKMESPKLEVLDRSTVRPLRQLKTSEKMYSCKKCTRHFPKVTLLGEHMRTAHNHRCVDCGVSFLYRYNMIEHQNSVHGRKRPLMMEVKKEESSDDSPPSGVLKRRSYYMNYLSQAKDKEADEPVKVKKEPKEYSDTPMGEDDPCKSPIQSDCGPDSTTPTKCEGIVNCTECGQGFKKQYNLDRHMKLHTGELKTFYKNRGEPGTLLKTPLAERPVENIGSSPGRNYDCRDCSQVFHSRGDLVKHRKIHDKSGTGNSFKDSLNENVVSSTVIKTEPL